MAAMSLGLSKGSTKSEMSRERNCMVVFARNISTLGHLTPMLQKKGLAATPASGPLFGDNRQQPIHILLGVVKVK